MNVLIALDRLQNWCEAISGCTDFSHTFSWRAFFWCRWFIFSAATVLSLCQYLLHSSDSNQSKPVSSDVLGKITSKGGKCWKFEREEARWAEEGWKDILRGDVKRRSILLLLPQANLYF